MQTWRLKESGTPEHGPKRIVNKPQLLLPKIKEAIETLQGQALLNAITIMRNMQAQIVEISTDCKILVRQIHEMGTKKEGKYVMGRS